MRFRGSCYKGVCGRSRFLKGLGSAALLLGLTLAVSATPAAALVTVGQTGTPSAVSCATNPRDRVQPTVTSGNSYVMPANGTITSWSEQADGTAGSVKMKAYRRASGNFWMVVGHDGPRTLTPNVLNAFSSNVAVEQGDVLGLSTLSTTDCLLPAPGDSNYFASNSDLADGASAEFFQGPGFTSDNLRVNVSAVLDPSNTLTFGEVTRNKKKGAATLSVDVPNAGQLDFAGTGAKVVETAGVKTVAAAGTVKFKVKAKGKKKKKLNQTGKVKVTATFTFTPTGGSAKTQSVNVKLRKRI